MWKIKQGHAPYGTKDLAAIQGGTSRVCLPPDNGPGREIVYPGNLRPNLVEYILNETTDFLQAEGHIALATYIK